MRRTGTRKDFQGEFLRRDRDLKNQEAHRRTRDRAPAGELANLTHAVQVSGDVANWNDVTSVVGALIDDGDGTETPIDA